MVSWRDEYEAWAVTRGEDGEVDLKKYTGKVCLKVSLKRCKLQAMRISRGSFFHIGAAA